MISTTTIQRAICYVLPMLWAHFREQVQWPNAEEWLQMANGWEIFPGGVAVIDGTRHRIQRSQTEPQQQFHSGHCGYHNFSTQIIMDNWGKYSFHPVRFSGSQQRQCSAANDPTNWKRRRTPLTGWFIHFG